MQQPLQQKLIIGFILLTAIDLVGIISGFSLLQYLAKPLLVPLLILLVFFTTNVTSGKRIIQLALFFSWLGDIFLLFDSKNAQFFIIGLICFLLAHTFYIYYFFSRPSDKSSVLLTNPLLPVLVCLYGVALVSLLFPHLGNLRIPVMIYAAFICTMLLGSLHVYHHAHNLSGRYFVSGAIAFVLSDSLLAINKFYQPFTVAAFAIMLTYCLAQYFIVRGFIEQS